MSPARVPVRSKGIMAVRYVRVKTPGLLPSAATIWHHPDIRVPTSQADVSHDNSQDKDPDSAPTPAPAAEPKDAGTPAHRPPLVEVAAGDEAASLRAEPTADQAASPPAALPPAATPTATAAPDATPAGAAEPRSSAFTSPDYYAIIAGAVAGLADNTAPARREFYDHARKVVEARLGRIEPAPPSHVIVTEKAALERAIKRIEAEQIAAALKAVADAQPPVAAPAPSPAPPPVQRVPPAKPTLPRAPKASQLYGSALRALLLMAVVAAGLFAYWFASGRLGMMENNGAPSQVADVPDAEAPDVTAETPATGDAPAEDGSAAQPAPDAPADRYARELTTRLAVCAPAPESGAPCGNLHPAPPDLSVPGAMPSWVASNAGLIDLRPPKTVTQWPSAAGPSPLAPGGMALATSATSGRIVSGPARERFESGKARLAADDVEGAIADFSEAIRLDPRFDDAFLQRGQASFRIGNVERAIADFTQALELDPRSFAAYKARGMAFFYKNQTDDALIDLTRAIQFAMLEPAGVPAIELFYARRSRATLYDRKQLYDREILDLTAMIDGYWKNPELAATLKAAYGDEGTLALVAALYKQRSSAHLRRKSIDSAIGDLSLAMRIDQAHALQYLVERARLQESAGRRAEAAADYRQALALNPGSDDLRAALARVQSNP